MKSRQAFLNPFVSFFLLSSIYSFFCLPVTSQSASLSDKQCANTLGGTKTRLNKIKSLQLMPIKIMNISQNQYIDSPANRSKILYLNIVGSGGENLMNSPKLMQDISANIIKNCNSIAAISFNIAQTDWGEIYGIVADGSVVRFKCSEMKSDMSDTRLVWGNHVCL
jgi:hypothetical protein